MKLKSLGYRSDLIFPKFEGEVEDHGSYIRVRTPSNPTYWWGNFLLFEHPPQEGEFAHWMKVFEQEIGTPLGVTHRVFAWDLSLQKAFVRPFLDEGFEPVSSVVMTARNLQKPERYNSDVEMRTLETDADFEELLELNLLLNKEDGFEGPSHRLFLQKKLARYRKMVAAGLGAWFGAYSDGRLVSYMGLFHDGDIARYQTVATHPEYRRRGIAGTLTHFVGEYGLTHFGVNTLVIIADDNYFAKDVYASVGFEPTELIGAVERPPQTA